MPTLHAVTGLIRAGNTRKGADSLSNFCLDDLIIKLVKLNSSLVIFGSFIARYTAWVSRYNFVKRIYKVIYCHYGLERHSIV